MTTSHSTTAAVHCAATDDSARKAFATLAARAALAGHQCTRTAIGNIILSRWGYASIFDDVAKAGAWLDRVTGGVA